MTDPTQPSSPGERRLDRPPSDRYREATTAAGATEGTAARAAVSSGSLPRAVGFGILVGLVGAVVTILLGGVLGMSAGLLVVAAATGWAIGNATKIGGGPSVRASRRIWIAVAIALIAVVVGQVGLWLYAGTEGGVLSLPDYLGETFGPLVPLQIVLAAALAWWAAR